MARYKVEGMSCGKCVAHVERTLKELAEARAVKVSLEAAEAEVDWVDAPGFEAVRAALAEEGYEAAEL